MSKRSYLQLIAIVVLGAALRFSGLEVQSLWNDELLIWDRTNAASVSSLITKGAHFGTIHPPGYLLLMYGSRSWFGDSEAALRVPSAIAGVLAIVAIFFLGRRLYSETEGLIAAALMAVLWAPIYYSQEARSYSLLLLFSILTTHCWITLLEMLERRGQGARSWRRDLGPILHYLATAIVCAYLHYFGLYLVVLQGAGACLCFIRRPRLVLAVLAIYAPLVAAYLPWAPAMLHDASAFEKGFDTIKTPGGSMLFDVPRFFFSRSRPLLPIVLLLYLTFFARRAWNWYRGRGNASPAVLPFLSSDQLVVLWFVVPFAIIFIESILFRPLVTERNLLIILPAAHLLAARALAELRLPFRPRYLAAWAFAGVFLLHLFVVKQYYWRPTKQQFREAIQYVVERAPSYPRSIVTAGGNRSRYVNYYLTKFDFPDQAWRVNDDLEVRQLLGTDGVRFIWFIHSPGIGRMDSGPFLRNGLPVVERKRFHKIDVWLFAVPGEAAAPGLPG